MPLMVNHDDYTAEDVSKIIQFINQKFDVFKETDSIHCFFYIKIMSPKQIGLEMVFRTGYKQSSDDITYNAENKSYMYFENWASLVLFLVKLNNKLFDEELRNIDHALNIMDEAATSYLETANTYIDEGLYTDITVESIRQELKGPHEKYQTVSKYNLV